MIVTFEYLKYNNPVYYQFTLLAMQYINTIQVRSISITLFNLHLKILHVKKQKNNVEQGGP